MYSNIPQLHISAGLSVLFNRRAKPILMLTKGLLEFGEIASKQLLITVLLVYYIICRADHIDRVTSKCTDYRVKYTLNVTLT